MIEVDNMSLNFNKVPILKQVSFKINNGEFWSVIGPNGAGKTSLLRTLTAYYPKTSGFINIDGKAIESYTQRQLAQKFSLVPQNNILSFDFRVIELVLLGKNPYLKKFQQPSKEDEKRAKEILESIGISNLAKRKYNTLSGGEQQLVGIAMCLMQKTPYVLLDEPTNHLDPYFQILMLNIFKKKLEKEDITIITVFHDLNLALNNSQKTILIKNGKILSIGDTNKVITEKNIELAFRIETEIHEIANKKIIMVKKSA